jgi:hypothetical protein
MDKPIERHLDRIMEKLKLAYPYYIWPTVRESCEPGFTTLKAAMAQNR